MVSGPRAGVIAAVAYLSMGFINLPVFHGGGGLNYLLEPSFGYLAGFVPAAWLTGRLAHQTGMQDLPKQCFAAGAGLLVLQLCGLLNLGLGALFGRWSSPVLSLIMQYSINPLPAQIFLCIASGLLAVILRRLLIVES
jgi:biotin transport system substrate-specific component